MLCEPSCVVGSVWEVWVVEDVASQVRGGVSGKWCWRRW